MRARRESETAKKDHPARGQREGPERADQGGLASLTLNEKKGL